MPSVAWPEWRCGTSGFLKSERISNQTLNEPLTNEAEHVFFVALRLAP